MSDKMHEVLSQNCRARLRTATVTCVKHDLPKRQFAQDLLKIKVEKDYAIHSIQRQEAVFRRRYCHLISRVESLGRPNAYQGKRPSAPVPFQSIAPRRTSDPEPRFRSKFGNSQKLEQSNTHSSDVSKRQRLRSSSLPNIMPSVYKGSNKHFASPPGKTPEIANNKVMTAERKCIPESKRVSISNVVRLCSPPGVRASSPLSIADSSSRGDPINPGDTTAIAAGKPNTNTVQPSLCHDFPTVDLSVLDIEDKSVCNHTENDKASLVDDGEQSTSVHNLSSISARRESLNKFHETVFVDYGPTTIDKIFNALFDPELDEDAEEAGNRSDDTTSDHTENSPEDDGVRRRTSLKTHQLRHRINSSRQQHFGRTGGRDNSVETLQKCRYLRLPAHRFRNNKDTEETSNIWRF